MALEPIIGSRYGSMLANEQEGCTLLPARSMLGTDGGRIDLRGSIRGSTFEDGHRKEFVMVEMVASSFAPIVVAVDFEKPSAYALRRGAEIFRRSPAFELEVLHVIERAGAGELRDPQLVKLVHETPARLERFVHESLGEPSVFEGRHIGIHVRSGQVAEEIVKFADDVGAQLVIVGSHRRKGLTKKVLGSTSERVLELAHTSVTVASSDPAADVAIEPPCPQCRAVRARHAPHGMKQVAANP
jgi:nucleotide-binding universal stress UspA family protein